MSGDLYERACADHDYPIAEQFAALARVFWAADLLADANAQATFIQRLEDLRTALLKAQCDLPEWLLWQDWGNAP